MFKHIYIIRDNDLINLIKKEQWDKYADKDEISELISRFSYVLLELNDLMSLAKTLLVFSELGVLSAEHIVDEDVVMCTILNKILAHAVYTDYIAID